MVSDAVIIEFYKEQTIADFGGIIAAEGTDNDAIYLERAISREKDPELRKALR